MKKLISIVVLLTMTLSIFTACGLKTNVKRSTIFVEDDNKIVQATIEKFDNSNYSEKELREFVNKQLKAYKQSGKDGSVKLQKLTVKNNKVRLFLEYSNYKAFAGFNDETFFSGNVVLAQADGYEFDIPFYKAADAKMAIDSKMLQKENAQQSESLDTENSNAATETMNTESETAATEQVAPDAATEAENSTQKSSQTKVISSVPKEKILSDDNHKVVIVEENTDVMVKGKILYVSSHVKVTGKNTATVTDEGSDSTDVTPAYIIYE